MKVAPENAFAILQDIARDSRELALFFSIKLPLFLFFLILLYIKKKIIITDDPQ